MDKFSAECPGILGCDVLLGEWFLMSQRNIVPLSSGSSSSRRTFLSLLELELLKP
jgi:hypothetical protein